MTDRKSIFAFNQQAWPRLLIKCKNALKLNKYKTSQTNSLNVHSSIGAERDNGETSPSQADKFQGNFLCRFAGVKQLCSVDFMKIWSHYDKDGSGFLDNKELDSFLRDLLCHRTGELPNADTVEELRRGVMEKIDFNRDGKIELGEFACLLPIEENFMKKFSSRKSLSRKNFDEIFRHYDPDGNGFIEGKELLALIRDIMLKAQESVTLQDVQDYKEIALKVFDKNTDGKLSRRELGLLLSIDK